MRLVVVAATLLLGAATAAAQPLDPYAPPPDPAAVDPAAAADVELDESVAVALLDRARVLKSEGAYADAKQLVIEAMQRRPSGPTHDAATRLLEALNRQLGIGERPVPVPDPIAPPADVRPPVLDELDPPPPPPARSTSGATALAIYGATAGAALALGLYGVDDAGPAIGLAAAGAVTGGLLGRYAAHRKGYDRAAAHAIGSGVVWGAIAGGLFADVVSGLEATTASDVAVGVGLGAVGGGLVASLLRTPELTVGDAALIDSVAGWGTTAAIALAFAIAPAETEAYTLNGTLGAAGGYVIGHVAARGREVSAGRLAKVNGIAAVGAAAPWLLYALVADDGVDDDEQAFGWLSMAGLGAGIYFGFRWTTEPASPSTVDDAPAAVVRRSSTGAWTMGGPALAPIRTEAGDRGLAVTVLGGAW